MDVLEESGAMDKSQAEAISEAVVTPELNARRERRELRAAAEAKRAAAIGAQRIAAWFGLVGAILGALFGHVGGVGMGRGIVWVGLPLTLLGWGVAYWKNWRVSASAD
jgi:hypothetical protein|mmetsp:Transcript_26059/g.33857  ORF Transcript_26059/g.33857 Transcript_26059/m.33857 type:complete len:108 (-) Transcript_26059:23-346(-)